MRNVKDRISNRIVQLNETVLHSLQQMDLTMVKLLFVFDGEQFAGLLSIGDLQRAIINNRALDTPVKEIMRRNITVAREGDSKEAIRQQMLEFRAECMPVLDEAGNLSDVFFWEDMFTQDEQRVTANLHVPVVIMAGGKGTRLKPLTNIIPKPLIPIGEKTIIEVIIDKFCGHGAREFFISVNYKQELIKFYFDQIADKPYEIEYVSEKDFSGTAGSLSLLKGKLHSTFFVSNCDILIEDDYSEIYNFHREHGNSITVVASMKHFKIPYGTIESGENGELLSLQEKPELTFKINTGMYVLEPGVLDSIPDGRFYHITDLITDLRAEGHKIGVFPVSEKSWFDMGEWPEYQKVIDSYNAGK